ncbi:MAG: hypothetical protein WA722_11575 [Candidatus Sulfotelmatobacter sp.]
MSTTQIAQPMTDAEVEQLCINTIRTLSIDAVQQRKFGFEPDRVVATAKEVLGRA